MSAQIHSPTLGSFEPTARPVDWLRAMDPVVRNLATLLVASGIATLTAVPVLGVVLMALGTGFAGWSKPDAVANHHEQEALNAALRDLDDRLRAGDLDVEGHAVRRNWLITNARL